MDDKRKLAIYEELVLYLVKHLNMYNKGDMLGGYLNALMEGDEVFEPNMALGELGLPTLEYVEDEDED